MSGRLNGDRAGLYTGHPHLGAGAKAARNRGRGLKTEPGDCHRMVLEEPLVRSLLVPHDVLVHLREDAGWIGRWTPTLKREVTG